MDDPEVHKTLHISGGLAVFSQKHELIFFKKKLYIGTTEIDWSLTGITLISLIIAIIRKLISIVIQGMATDMQSMAPAECDQVLPKQQIFSQQWSYSHAYPSYLALCPTPQKMGLCHIPT